MIILDKAPPHAPRGWIASHSRTDVYRLWEFHVLRLNKPIGFRAGVYWIMVTLTSAFSSTSELVGVLLPAAAGGGT